MFPVYCFRYNIKICGFSSDGDSRLLTSMKHSLNAIFNQPSYDVLSNLSREQYISFIQDTTHIATKLRNRLLKLSILLPMGFKQVSVAHLKILINTTPKEVHGLVYSDICPVDRQNYDSYEKMTSDRVLNALEKNVLDSEGTVKYLKVCRQITQSFLDPELEPLERVYMLWHSLYFLRAWRKWILRSQNDDGTQQYIEVNNFITSNAFNCIELNAYGMLHLICKFRDSMQPELFLPGLFSSQPCEKTFGQFRSMTTANWTKLNFSLHEVFHLMSRIEIQNDISQFKLADIVSFPRFQNRKIRHKLHALPTNDQIQQVLDQAIRTAIIDAKDIGMDVIADDIRACEIVKGAIPRKKGVPKHSDIDLMGESDDLEENISYDVIDCSYMRDYSGRVDEIDGNSPFVIVFDKDGSEKLIRKSTIAWIASDTKGKLSNDRLKRVQSVNVSALPQTKKKKVMQNGADLFVSNEIHIGDWCAFYGSNEIANANGGDPVFDGIVVGAVLSFKYATGKNEKDKQYGLNSAPVSVDELSSDKSKARGIEVLSTWYKYTDCSALAPFSKNNSFFININKYIANLTMPTTIQDSASNKMSYEIRGNMDEFRKTLSEILSE